MITNVIYILFYRLILLSVYDLFVLGFIVDIFAFDMSL